MLTWFGCGIGIGMLAIALPAIFAIRNLRATQTKLFDALREWIFAGMFDAEMEILLVEELKRLAPESDWERAVEDIRYAHYAGQLSAGDLAGCSSLEGAHKLAYKRVAGKVLAAKALE